MPINISDQSGADFYVSAPSRGEVGRSLNEQLVRYRPGGGLGSFVVIEVGRGKAFHKLQQLQ